MVSAVFEFFAKNPPSIAIAGAILMWITGSLMQPTGSGQELLTWAPLVFVAGIVLQVAWLFLRR